MNNILRNLIETNDDFTTCIKNSYSKTLGPHHGFIVRNSAKLAMSFAPSKRSVPMKYLIGNVLFNSKGLRIGMTR